MGAGSTPSAHGSRPAFAPLLRLVDGATLSVLSNGLTLHLTDRIVEKSVHGDYRAYQIIVHSAVPLPLVGVRLITDPVQIWGNPRQMPGGADALPALSNWSWSVRSGSSVVTSTWGPNFLPGTIGRTITWGDYTYTVSGTIRPKVALMVHFNETSGLNAPSIGYTLDGSFSPSTNALNDPDYSQIGGALHPQIVRFGLTTSGSKVTWDSTTHQPVFGWTNFDRFPAYAHQLHARTLLQLPVGTWGDGNSLPKGMPLDRAMAVHLLHPGSPNGYFPTLSAYSSYVAGVVAHAKSTNLGITYWSIGNEMPLLDLAVTNQFIRLFNVASTVIHHSFPGALVGSDVMTNRTYIDDFARTTHGVGFLSFHYYAALAMCIQNGQYCPPQGSGLGTTDTALMSSQFDLAHGLKFLAPHLSQVIWHNLTGKWLPIIDAETNLHAAGGPALYGTDPRQQTPFAAAWLGSTLLNAAQEHVASVLYYVLTGNATVPNTFTARYGGYGFGMTSEGTHDNDTRYAPYWAFMLWSQAAPAGSPGVITTGSSPSTAEAIAFRYGSTVSVVVVNRANLSVPVTVGFQGDGAVSPAGLAVFNASTYAYYYSHYVDAGSSGGSAIDYLPAPHGSPMGFTLRGYSIAVLTVHLTDPHAVK